MKIKAVIHEAPEGGYWAKVPSLPSVYTQAETLPELEANLREAIELYLSDDGKIVARANRFRLLMNLTFPWRGGATMA